MKFSKILAITIGLSLPLLSFGKDNIQALFDKGSAYYAKADYPNAIATWQKVLNSGYQSAALYFNLGNANFKNGDVTPALWYYEKAHKLSPGDEDINFNIRFANLRTTDKVEEAPEFFLTKWWHGFILSISVNALAIISIVLVFFASALLTVYFFSNSVAIKKASFYTSLVLFFAALISLFIADRQVNYFTGHKQAIIFTHTVNVKGGPVEKSNLLFVLHDGTMVNVVETVNGWIKIKLVNNNEGWIRLSDVKMI